MSFRPSAAAFVVAVAAGVLRAQFVYFPTDAHADEAIAANLAMRTIAAGRWSANWDGFAGAEWSRPTYQFAPYMALENNAACLCSRLFSWPIELADHIRFGRRFSIVSGALAVWVAFLAGRAWGGDARAGFIAQAFLSVAFLHVQDSCYARPEALLSLALLLSLWAAACVTTCVRSAVRLGLFVGLAVAIKYNAAPAVVLLWSAKLGGGWRGLAFAMTAAAVGFALGTPEIFVDPQPFFAGLQYEIAHYRDGHIPHQAFDAGDWNVVYWLDYLCRLGLGWAPTLLATAFVARWPWLDPRQRVLAMFLASAFATTVVPRVRFERNAEVFLGAACVCAGLAAAELWRIVQGERPKNRLTRGWYVPSCPTDNAGRGRQDLPRPADSQGESLGLDTLRWPLAILAFAVTLQPLLQSAPTLWRFRQTQRRDASPLTRIPQELRKARFLGQHLWMAPPAEWRTYDVLLLDGHSDRYSAAALEEWRTRLEGYELQTIRSPWLAWGYPFSTVETYHGPGLILTARRKAPP